MANSTNKAQKKSRSDFGNVHSSPNSGGTSPTKDLIPQFTKGRKPPAPPTSL